MASKQGLFLAHGDRPISGSAEPSDVLSGKPSCESERADGNSEFPRHLAYFSNALSPDYS
jgi:hypothetical protein